MNQFIPLIQFVEISATDFYDKVHSYKAIIPCRIYEEAIEFYLIGGRKLKSTIIKSNLAQIGLTGMNHQFIHLTIVTV